MTIQYPDIIDIISFTSPDTHNLFRLFFLFSSEIKSFLFRIYICWLSPLHNTRMKLTLTTSHLLLLAVPLVLLQNLTNATSSGDIYICDAHSHYIRKWAKKKEQEQQPPLPPPAKEARNHASFHPRHRHTDPFGMARRLILRSSQYWWAIEMMHFIMMWGHPD